MIGTRRVMRAPKAINGLKTLKILWKYKCGYEHTVLHSRTQYKKKLGFMVWKLFISMCQHGKSYGGGSLAGDDEP